MKRKLIGVLAFSVLLLSGCSSSQDSAQTAEELNNAILNEVNTQNGENAVKSLTGKKYLTYGGDFNNGYDAGIKNIKDTSFLVLSDKHSFNIYLIDKAKFNEWSSVQKMPSNLITTSQIYESNIIKVSEAYKGINENYTYYEILELDSMVEATDVPQYN